MEAAGQVEVERVVDKEGDTEETEGGGILN